jgi:hypothetical protein
MERGKGDEQLPMPVAPFGHRIGKAKLAYCGRIAQLGERQLDKQEC